MEDITVTAIERRLYSPWQVTGAALLGGALAGLWLVADNFLVLGKPSKARKVRIAAIGIALAILVFAIFGPELRSNTVFAALCAAFVRFYAISSYGHAYETHIGSGGPKRPQWQWVVAGLAGLGATMAIGMALFFGLAAVAPDLLPDRFFE
jgi:hypothetical protein